MTRAELLERMSGAEAQLWRELWRVEPWGEPAADERTSALAAVVNRSAGGKATPATFRLRWTPPEPRAPTIDFKTGIRMLANRQRQRTPRTPRKT